MLFLAWPRCGAPDDDLHCVQVKDRSDDEDLPEATSGEVASLASFFGSDFADLPLPAHVLFVLSSHIFVHAHHRRSPSPRPPKSSLRSVDEPDFLCFTAPIL